MNVISEVLRSRVRPAGAERDDHPAPSLNPGTGRRAALNLLKPLGIYLATRLGVLLIVSSLALVKHKSVIALLRLWDSDFYVRVAEFGYPKALPPSGASHHAWSNLIAFFPGFRFLSRSSMY